MEKLQLLDQATGKLFSWTVSSDVAKKAYEDIVFATNLLEMMKAQELAPEDAPRGLQEQPDEVEDGGKCSREMPGYDGGECSKPAVLGDEDTFRWSHPAILLLVESFKELEPKMSGGRISGKKGWEVVANTLRARGIEVTGPQCKSKMAGLKKTYKSIKDHNKKSGNSSRQWPYFELLDGLFHNQPWVAPSLSLESCSMEQEASSSGSSSPAPCTPNRKRKASIDSLLESLRESREQRARLHSEAMERQDRLLEFLTSTRK